MRPSEKKVDLPILWKHNDKDIDQEQAERLLEQVAGKGVVAVILIQVGAGKSGSVEVRDGLLHYSPK